jgi:hypothetical protein
VRRRLPILGVAFAALLPGTAPAAPDSVPCTERLDGKVGIALDSFRQDVGRYPTTAEGLAALRARPPAVPAREDGRRFGWDGPYLDLERDLRDSRGRRLGYRSPAADGRSWEIWVIEGGE